MNQPDEKLMNLLAALANMTTEKGASEAEAATAMQKMQKLLFEHNMSMSDIKVGDKQSKTGTSVKDEYTRATERTNVKPGAGFKQRSSELPAYERQWRIELAQSIARYNFCKTLIGYQWRAVWFVGSETNIAAVKAIWAYAIEQIDRLSYEALATRRRTKVDAHESGKSWRAQWLYGCVARVTERLRENWEFLQKQSAASTALVVSNTQDINDYMATRWPAPKIDPDVKPRKPRKSDFLKDHSAYGAGTQHGYAAGNRVDLSPSTKIR